MPVSSSESPARAAFRYPSFRYYMTARFLIAASSEMQSVGVAWQIYGIRHRPLDLGLVGVVRAFNAPASQAFLPLLVPTEHFPNAVAWSSSIFQSATILVPMAGGLLY